MPTSQPNSQKPFATRKGGMLRRLKDQSRKLTKGMNRRTGAKQRSASSKSLGSKADRKPTHRTHDIGKGEKEDDEINYKSPKGLVNKTGKVATKAVSNTRLPKSFTVRPKLSSIFPDHLRKYVLRACPSNPLDKELPPEIYNQVLQYYQDWHEQARFIDLSIFGYPGAAVSEDQFFKHIVIPLEAFKRYKLFGSGVYEKFKQHGLRDDFVFLRSRVQKCLVHNATLSGDDDIRHILFIRDRVINPDGSISPDVMHRLTNKEKEYVHAYNPDIEPTLKYMVIYNIKPQGIPGKLYEEAADDFFYQDTWKDYDRPQPPDTLNYVYDDSGNLMLLPEGSDSDTPGTSSESGGDYSDGDWY